MTRDLYDSEFHIGLVANDKTAGTRNADLLSEALEAQRSGGSFRFRRGGTGPILGPISCAARDFYFSDAIEFPTRLGGVLKGRGGRPYPTTNEQYNTDGSYGGLCTKFIWTNGGTTGGSGIKLRGNGALIEDIQLLGRPFEEDFTGKGPASGTKLRSGI